MAEQVTVALKCDWEDVEDFPSCEERAVSDSTPLSESARTTLFRAGWRWVTLPPYMPNSRRVLCPKHADQFKRNGGSLNAQAQH